MGMPGNFVNIQYWRDAGFFLFEAPRPLFPRVLREGVLKGLAQGRPRCPVMLFLDERGIEAEQVHQIGKEIPFYGTDRHEFSVGSPVDGIEGCSTIDKVGFALQ